MHEEQDRHVDRDPGRVEEPEQSVAGEELAQGREILDRLGAGLTESTQIGVEHGGEQPGVERHVEAGADTHQDARAHHLQTAHEQIQPDHQQREDQQGHLAAAGEHAVIDLQHVERRRQQEQIDEGAE